VTEEIGTQTHDKAKGLVEDLNRRRASSNGEPEYVLSDIGPPQEGTVSMQDGILLVQVSLLFQIAL
jgi:hypothetical protein